MKKLKPRAFNWQVTEIFKLILSKRKREKD